MGAIPYIPWPGRKNRSADAYDSRRLSYANTFPDPVRRRIIQAIEICTGKLRLLSKVRKFETMGIPYGQPFWSQALSVMGIELHTPDHQITRIPATGPVVVVANHPHGLVDGLVLAELVGRVRQDYKILTRSLLTGVDQIEDFMIPVPFDHEEDAIKKSLVMRNTAMSHLAQGGVIVVFPSGKVATSDSMFGPVIEGEWNPFTAKMIQKSGAAVVPVYFPGGNSRAYQIAAQISPTIRQGLLIHEVVHALNKPQKPIVGEPITRHALQKWSSNPRGFMGWLRQHTISLT